MGPSLYKSSFRPAYDRANRRLKRIEARKGSSRARDFALERLLKLASVAQGIEGAAENARLKARGETSENEPIDFDFAL